MAETILEALEHEKAGYDARLKRATENKDDVEQARMKRRIGEVNAALKAEGKAASSAKADDSGDDGADA